ncbi:ferredoxin [Kitasatospora sp. MAP5-34]|uniref:ferredoxin n=1 Tax=Kitasatospora sp. MAP5-34 TaxID=3035102 RepID=UPI002476D7DA|nr:ferredoxin [Kitasatospora sp. MAP5-34]MDH6577912.1 ferredoxin [Kitasatospora sp. MAP5-34]
MSAAGPDLELVVRVDQTRCVGTGHCAASAPDDLALGPNGRAYPTHPTSTARDQLSEAADLCPVEAITVHLARTGEQIAPLD